MPTPTQNLIVSTCGTSILTNNTVDKIRILTNKYANSAIDADVESELTEHVNSRKQQILKATNEELKRMSAELNCLLSFYGGFWPTTGIHTSDQHILLATDTYLGQKTAEIVRDVLLQRGFSAKIHIIKNMNTQTVRNFQDGLQDLVRFCYDTYQLYCESYHIIFNLAGGFKSLSAYANILGMLYAHEQIYIFEGQNNPILRIPRLPLSLDAEQLINDQAVFQECRNLAIQGEMDAKFLPIMCEKYANLIESISENGTTYAGFSFLGEVLWQEVSSKMYEKTLLDAPTGVRYTDNFLRTVKKFSEKYATINKQIDAMSRYVTSQYQNNPKGLDVRIYHAHDGRYLADAWRGHNGSRFILKKSDDGKLEIEDLVSHREMERG